MIPALYLNPPLNCARPNWGLKINSTAGTNNDFTVYQLREFFIVLEFIKRDSIHVL